MGDAAKEVKKDTVTLDGLDKMFSDGHGTHDLDTQQTSDTSRDKDTQLVIGHDSLTTVSVEIEEKITVRQAAKILGIHKRSVNRLIEQKKLDAELIDNQYFVHRKDVEKRKQRLEDKHRRKNESKLSGQDMETVTQNATTSKRQTQDQDTRPMTEAIVTDIDESMTSYERGGDLLNSQNLGDSGINVQELLDNYMDAQKELQAANYRVGYLESQIEERKKEVVLLEDKKSEYKKDSELLQSVQVDFSKLESDHQQLEGKAQELENELERYRELLEKPGWKKFCDWMLGRK